MEHINVPSTDEEYIKSVRTISGSISWAIKYYNDNHLEHRRIRAKLNGKPYKLCYNYRKNNNDKKTGFNKRNKVLRQIINNK